MDWERKSLEWLDEDFDKFNYALREAVVVTKLQTGEVGDVSTTTVGTDKQLTSRQGRALVEPLATPDDWKLWFKRASRAKRLGAFISQRRVCKTDRCIQATFLRPKERRPGICVMYGTAAPHVLQSCPSYAASLTIL